MRLVVNQALTSGLKVLVSKVEGVTDSVHSMSAVYLAEPKVTDIVRAMEKVAQNQSNLFRSHKYYYIHQIYLQIV